MDHLSDQQLINLAFDLVDEREAAQGQTHLRECKFCRQRQAEQQRRLAGLDHLAEDISLNDSLIARTVQSATTLKRRRRFFLPWWGNHRRRVQRLSFHNLIVRNRPLRLPVPSSW